MWEIWCKAIGTKAYNDKEKADQVARKKPNKKWRLKHV